MKKILFIILVVCLFCGVLVGCGGNKSDSIIKQINSEITRMEKTTKSNYIFSEQFYSAGFQYVVYEGKEYSGYDQKDYTSKCSIIYEKGEFLGIKLECENESSKNYRDAKYALYNIKEFEISDIDYKTYLNKIGTYGNEIGKYKVYFSGNGSGKTFKLISKDSSLGSLV